MASLGDLEASFAAQAEITVKNNQFNSLSFFS